MVIRNTREDGAISRRQTGHTEPPQRAGHELPVRRARRRGAECSTGGEHLDVPALRGGVGVEARGAVGALEGVGVEGGVGVGGAG